MNYYPNIKHFNVPTILQFSSGLRDFELHVSFSRFVYICLVRLISIQVEAPTENTLDIEMTGALPSKLQNISFSGKGLKKLGSKVLQVCEIFLISEI